MDGYFHRIWGKLGVNKVSQANRGVYLVRFDTIEARNAAMEQSTQMFNKKLVIVKQWNPGMELTKVATTKIPIWIRLRDVHERKDKAATTDDTLQVINRFEALDEGAQTTSNGGTSTVIQGVGSPKNGNGGGQGSSNG
ncbi:hypothetical protein FXO37_03094 [Capsicum annuum]|nr:hypothetical protein FXO37_03094 [Capsicum annuum]